MSQVTINRNPFARFDFIRKTVDYHYNPGLGGCSFCGGNNAHGKLFRYGTHGDQCRDTAQYAKGAFCSVGCYRAYHNE